MGNIAFSSQAVPTGSPAGSTFSNAKIASVIMAPSTAAASSSAALLNTDASDRYIESIFADCNTVATSRTYLTGAGLDLWRLSFATSSAASQTGNANVLTMSIATATPDRYNYEGTSTSTADYLRVWKTGTYLIPTFNATNTASCVVGAHYLAS